MPLDVLKLAIGILWIATLCHDLSFWACLNKTKYSQIDYLSRRKLAENALVIVITKFWPSNFVTKATTSPLIPLSRNALLKAFCKARGEKLRGVVLTRISLLSLLLALVIALALG